MATNTHAGDSWPIYITSIIPDKCSNAPKKSKENGLNKSVSSSSTITIKVKNDKAKENGHKMGKAI